MDLDGNGSIDAEELGLVLKSFGEAVPPGRLKALIREVSATLLVVNDVVGSCSPHAPTPDSRMDDVSMVFPEAV